MPSPRLPEQAPGASARPAGGTHSLAPSGRRVDRFRDPAALPGMGLLLLLLALLASCGQRAPLPPLPGVENGDEEWFWRDVLAAPLPGEAAPVTGLSGLSSPAERESALSRLVADHSPALLTTLMGLLRDPSQGVAIVAAHELGRLGDRSALPRLIKGLGPYPVDYDVPIAVRVAEASALASLGHPAGLDLILAVLAEGTDLQWPRDSLPWVETERMVFLRELALPGLVALAGDDFGYVPNASVPARAAAVSRAMAFADERGQALWLDTAPFDEPGLVTRVRLMVAHLGAYQLRQVDGARHTLTLLGPAVLPFLAEGLTSPVSYVRVHCLEVMRRLAERHGGKTADRLAVLAAGPLLDDEDGQVAAAAARVCGAARVADPLVAALDRRLEPDVQLALIDALGQTRLPVAADVLASYQPAAPAGPDLRAALESARLATDPERSPDGLLAMLGSSQPDTFYPALERLIALTGADQGLSAGQSEQQRAHALARARAALLARPH